VVQWSLTSGTRHTSRNRVDTYSDKNDNIDAVSSDNDSNDDSDDNDNTGNNAETDDDDDDDDDNDDDHNINDQHCCFCYNRCYCHHYRLNYSKTLKSLCYNFGPATKKAFFSRFLNQGRMVQYTEILG